MSISILIASVAIMWGLYCIGEGLRELAEAIRHATTMRSIEIEGEPHRSLDGGWRIKVEIK